MPEVDFRELRQLWHDNPPVVVVMFGVVFFAAWYRWSNFAGVSPLLDLAALLLASGLLWEAVWLWRKHARSVPASTRPPRRVLHWVINASIVLWFVLLGVAFAVLYAPGKSFDLTDGLLFVGIFAAYPIGIACMVFIASRRIGRHQTDLGE